MDSSHGLKHQKNITGFMKKMVIKTKKFGCVLFWVVPDDRRFRYVCSGEIRIFGGLTSMGCVFLCHCP